MKKHINDRFWMVPFILLLLILMPLSGVWGEELAKEQTARLAMGVADIGTLDPHFSTKIGESPVVQMVYEALLRHPPGQINIEKIQPSLAERWEVAKDKLTWTFHLRKGVQWHGGYGEFTAEDVKFSLERVLNPDVGSPARKRLPAMESITIVDPFTIQIKTKKIVTDLPALLVNEMPGYVMCKKAVQKLGKDIKYQPIGTGPFMFSSYKPRESITLTANDAYWRGKPILRKVLVSYIPDHATRELALRNDEVDAINIPAKQEWIDRLRKAGFEVNLTSPANMFVLHFNLTKKPLDDIRVRKALCYAIDRQTLINYLGKDVAKPEYSPLPSGYVGHTDDVARYPYNPEKAKTLLAEAGFAKGFEMSMNISNSNIYLPPLQVIQEMWKKIGVTLNLNVVDHPTYHKLIRKDANPVVIYGAYRYPLTGNIYLNQFYHSASIVGKPTAIINFSHYGDALSGVDQYIDDARYELDVEKQKSLWIKAQKQIKRDAVSFPLFTRAYAMAKAKYLDLGFEQKSFSFYRITETARILKH
jgi:peptide/nickel transport system substrate-binding protein